MVTEYESVTATEAEVAAARAEAEEALSRERIKQGDRVASSGELPGQVKPMAYKIAESDRAAWAMGWELMLDRGGNVYGVPRKMPRNQIGLWLQKKRELDGGPRFTLDQPQRVLAEPQFPCLHEQCRKRLYTRQDVVLHVEAVHPRHARIYRKLLDDLMAKVAEDNPQVAALVAGMALQQEGVYSVDAKPKAREEQIDETVGAPVVTTLGLSGTTTGALPPQEPEETGGAPTPPLYWCEWEGCTRFFDSEQGRLFHARMHRKARG